jgi:hypothetical protein
MLSHAVKRNPFMQAIPSAPPFFGKGKVSLDLSFARSIKICQCVPPNLAGFVQVFLGTLISAFK